MKRYALGLDFGTNSCRSLIVDLQDGTETATAVFNYPSGELGIVLDEQDPNLARQNPRDYLVALQSCVPAAVTRARAADEQFDPRSIVSIGVDTTGSTPIPVDAAGVPLALDERFRDNPHAMAWLWKDHTAHAEAREITARAADMRPEYLAKCGGTYSSEWFWAKILHCKRSAPEVFAAAHSFVEHCDWIPALLSGNTVPGSLACSVCAAGHKAMYSPTWGGLPDEEFLNGLDPALVELRHRMYTEAFASDRQAGLLCEEWAAKLGLQPGIAIAVGAFDAHMGAVGAGISEGRLVKILGTSTCDMAVRNHADELPDIPGVCGIVDGSILPGFYGIEAGQSAVGDIFLWFVNRLVPDRYGQSLDDKFAGLAHEAGRVKPGRSGLLALDWNNGNRSILTDVRLSGLLLGQTLHTEPHHIYRALIEATAFGALTIVKRIEEYGVPVREIVNCGGLAVKNDLLMQIYADVLDRPMKVSASDQTCALGAALFGAVAAGKEAGGFGNVAEAQAVLCRTREKVYAPDKNNGRVYGRLYDLYRELHDAFGTDRWSGKMDHVMKDLIAIREGAS